MYYKPVMKSRVKNLIPFVKSNFTHAYSVQTRLHMPSQISPFIRTLICWQLLRNLINVVIVMVFFFNVYGFQYWIQPIFCNWNHYKNYLYIFSMKKTEETCAWKDWCQSIKRCCHFAADRPEYVWKETSNNRPCFKIICNNFVDLRKRHRPNATRKNQQL